jgi:hypothetical protein
MTKKQHRLRKGIEYRAIDCWGGLVRARCTIVDRVEGYVSRDPVTAAAGGSKRLPRVSVRFGKSTFHNVAVRSKFGIEFVDLRDIGIRVVAKLA